MQTLRPSLRLAMVIEISTSRNGCLGSSQKRSLLPFAQPSPTLASQHASPRSWAPSHQRRLRLPNKPLHLCCSHPYAPRNVAQPCNASSSLALRACGKAASQFIPRCARRSVSITRSAQAAANEGPHGQSSSARLARQAQAVFNQAMSLPATAANALPNNSLNRTHCGMRPKARHFILGF